MARRAKNFGLFLAGLMLAAGGVLLGIAGGISFGYSRWGTPPDCPILNCPSCPEPECPACPSCDAPEEAAAPVVTPGAKKPVVKAPEVPVEVPVEAPPVVKATVALSGDPPDQWWLEMNGRKVQGPSFEPGTYALWAGINGVPARSMGSVTIAEGQTVLHLHCSASWGKCRATK